VLPGPTRRPNVLVVEDDLANRALLTRLLERDGYHASAVENGDDALASITANYPDIVLLDIGLPGIDGLEVCRRLRSQPTTLTLPVILLTGRTSVDDLVIGLDAGADDFLGKPYQEAELLARIRSALRLRRAMAEMEAAHGVVAALANAVEAKDATTERHCHRLAGFAYRLALVVGLEGLDLKGVVFGALLHDVGKIGVPEAILSKPGPLTDDEWATMRRHPEIGEQICRPLVSSRLFAPIVRHHHERWDGLGYPDRLADVVIPIGARVVGLVDAFDAMTHDRPYRPAMRLEEALAEVRRQAGRQFDPDLAAAFITQIEAAGVGPRRPDIPVEALMAVAAAEDRE
jgi:putative two-component system response regulator